MKHKEAVDYFTNKYYEIARKYRVYTKCRDKPKFMNICVNTAIQFGLKGVECETIDKISEEKWKYFLMIGTHIVEMLIISAKAQGVV